MTTENNKNEENRSFGFLFVRGLIKWFVILFMLKVIIAMIMGL